MWSRVASHAPTLSDDGKHLRPPLAADATAWAIEAAGVVRHRQRLKGYNNFGFAQFLYIMCAEPILRLLGWKEFSQEKMGKQVSSTVEGGGGQPPKRTNSPPQSNKSEVTKNCGVNRRSLFKQTASWARGGVYWGPRFGRVCECIRCWIGSQHRRLGTTTATALTTPRTTNGGGAPFRPVHCHSHSSCIQFSFLWHCTVLRVRGREAFKRQKKNRPITFSRKPAKKFCVPPPLDLGAPRL